MLSKKAQDMLEYNGYSFKNENNQIVFRHSATDSIGLFIILFITLLILITLLLTVPFFGIGALLVSILIFRPIIKRDKGKSRLEIDTEKEVLEVNDNSYHMVNGFNEVTSVYTHSKFVDEYSSAFKSTSKEYRVTIGLEVNDRLVPLFKLIADHAKPSKEMNEVHGFLEAVIKKGKEGQDLEYN